MSALVVSGTSFVAGLIFFTKPRPWQQAIAVALIAGGLVLHFTTKG